MAKSLAELRAEKFSARPERPYTAVVGEGQKYVIEIQRLTAEHDGLVAEIAAIEDRLEAAQERAAERPTAMGEKVAPEVADLRARLTEARSRVNEIRVRLGVVTEQMADYEGEVTVRATRPDGDWAQWKIAHPARDEDKPGHRDDLMVSFGYCNAADLMDDIARYVVAWQGEPLAEGDFDALNLLPSDKKAIARIVVNMYEAGDDLPKLRSGLAALLKSADFSALPAPSASPSGGSSDGSPSSDTSTTTPTTA